MAKAGASAGPSTRRLSEVARHVVVPSGIVDTLWFQVERQCAEWGDSFDAWQDGLGQITLGLREDGTFAATVGGITWSIPRQVAKTFLVSRIVFALCIIFPNLTVLWTAHRTRTATQTFNKLKGLAQKPGVKPYMAAGGGIRSVNGEQEFEFANGSKIMFGAREQGFGRGFDEVDIEVFDEAQILTEKALEDMVAATNQSRFEFGALLFFMGTPPRPTDPGEEFANRRREALAHKPADVVYGVGEDSLYVECSADPGCGEPGGPDLDDPKQIEIANPSVPHRTPWISVKRLRKQLTSPGSWRREGLGIWDDDDALAKRVIMADEWEAIGVKTAPTEGVRSLGVKFSADGSRVAVAGALKHVGGVHVELIGDHSGSMAAGTASLVAWVAERATNYAAIVVDGKSHAGAFVNALIEAGVTKRAIVTPTWPQVATANQMLVQAVIGKTMTHLASDGQAVLDDSIAGSTKKVQANGVSPGAWSWEAIAEPGDEVPVAAAALAHWGAKTSKRKPGRKTRGRVMS